MTYQTTIGWSLVSSGIVTLVLKLLPGDSLWWGLALLALGVLVLYVRRT
jgi:MYXO-CTERM domain-containing protein